MRESQLHFEQKRSLVSRLVSAGIEHGDTAELTLEGVGAQQIEGQLVLAFCPTRVLNGRVLRRGTFDERQLQIPETVRVSNNLLKRLLWNATPNGFLRLRLRVHSNGFLQLSGRVIGAESVPADVPVCGTDSYRNCRDAGLLVSH